MPKTLKVSSKKKEPKPGTDAFDAVLYKGIAEHLITNLVTFRKKLTRAREQYHGGGNGRRLLFQLEAEFDKVIKIQ